MTILAWSQPEYHLYKKYQLTHTSREHLIIITSRRYARSKYGVQKRRRRQREWLRQKSGRVEWVGRGKYLAVRIGSRHHICLEQYYTGCSKNGLSLSHAWMPDLANSTYFLLCVKLISLGRFWNSGWNTELLIELPVICSLRTHQEEDQLNDRLTARPNAVLMRDRVNHLHFVERLWSARGWD